MIFTTLYIYVMYVYFGLLPCDALHSVDYNVARCLSISLCVHHTPVFCLNG